MYSLNYDEIGNVLNIKIHYSGFCRCRSELRHNPDQILNLRMLCNKVNVIDNTL